jgi:hypothetical protein
MDEQLRLRIRGAVVRARQELLEADRLRETLARASHVSPLDHVPTDRPFGIAEADPEGSTATLRASPTAKQQTTGLPA